MDKRNGERRTATQMKDSGMFIAPKHLEVLKLDTRGRQGESWVPKAPKENNGSEERSEEGNGKD